MTAESLFCVSEDKHGTKGLKGYGASPVAYFTTRFSNSAHFLMYVLE